MPDMRCCSEVVQPEHLPERKEGGMNKAGVEKQLKILVTKCLKDRLEVQQKQHP